MQLEEEKRPFGLLKQAERQEKMTAEYNIAWLNYDQQADLEQVLAAEMAKLGLQPYAQHYMAPKGNFYVLRAENISNAAANILKQECLAKGAEVAIHPMVIVGRAPVSAVIMMATERQYQLICEKLRLQQFGLPALAEAITTAIQNIKKSHWRIPYGKEQKKELILGEKTLVMGILNLTPDSFSDGGSYPDLAAAVARAKEMAAEGADIIDIGGESTRPNYIPVTVEEEIQRVVPVIQAVKEAVNLPVSIDTYKPQVAAAALAAGADILNDIWGLQFDPRMAEIAAEYQAPVVAMHNQEERGYGKAAKYPPELKIQGDMLGDMLAFFRKSLAIGQAAGMQENQFIFDIGFGFGKNHQQNLAALRALASLKVLGRPLFIGTSKKSTIGEVLQKEVTDRAWGTAATVAFGIQAGAQMVRVHDVKETVDVAKVTDAILASIR